MAPGDTEAAAQTLAETEPSRLAEELPAELMQRLMTGLVKAYVLRRQQGETFAPVTSAVTATEVSVTANGLVSAADMELFELTLWNSWGKV